MYINISNDLIVDFNDIILFFDTENTTLSKEGGKYLVDAEKNKRIVDLSKNSFPRSFMVVMDKETNEETVYLLSMTTQSILKTLKTFLKYYRLIHKWELTFLESVVKTILFLLDKQQLLKSNKQN